MCGGESPNAFDTSNSLILFSPILIIDISAMAKGEINFTIILIPRAFGQPSRLRHCT